jgi:hypothetical protein
MSENRQYMIFAMSEVNQIDFNEVLETSESTIRKSVDNLKSLVKWEGDTIPTCLQGMSTTEGPYNYEEILAILDTPEWMQPI